MGQEVVQPTFSFQRCVWRAFRPLFWWLAISAILLPWDYHRRHAARTYVLFEVSVEGQPVLDPRGYAATLGQHSVIPGSVVPVGWRTFRVDMPDAEPFGRRVFIWYRTNDLGRADLVWS